ncbi:MAG: DNA repair protein RecO [Nevskia sp.]|nr:DNA repair protein RecO [Nevskia sp.]
MRVQLEPAYVLARRPYRETSLLLEVFSEAHGRLGLVARGARGPRAGAQAILQPFTPLLLSWSETGELGTLSAAEAAAPPAAISGERIFHGWYLNELLLGLVPRHDPHPALYHDYAAALAQLAGDRAEAALRIFEKRLLAALGYALPLGAVDPARTYRYSAERGLDPVPAGTAGGCSGTSLVALREERLESREALREARIVLRAALAHRLGGRELKTPRLLRAMRAGVVGRGSGNEAKGG